MKQMQANVIQQPQEQQGDPLLGALGTFLPMAFGLPPIPQLGQMLGGPSFATQLGGMVGMFGANPFGSGNPFNLQDPFMNRMQGIPNPWNPYA